MRKAKRNIKLDIFALFIMLAALVTGCWNDKEEAVEQITVFAAASTTNAVTEISKEFTKTTGIEVITNFASSSTLAQQIETGAEADIYISANQKWGDYLEDKQLCSERKTILGNRIVIAVPAGSSLKADSAEILTSEAIKNIAMGDPGHVPAGKYGKEALEKTGIWQKVESKVIAAKDVRSALAYVETEAAEAGIVYSTDAAISDKVKVIYLFPVDATEKPISYPAMILKGAVNEADAAQYFEFLDSDIAKSIFEKYGFVVNTN